MFYNNKQKICNKTDQNIKQTLFESRSYKKKEPKKHNNAILQNEFVENSNQ